MYQYERAQILALHISHLVSFSVQFYGVEGVYIILWTVDQLENQPVFYSLLIKFIVLPNNKQLLHILNSVARASCFVSTVWSFPQKWASIGHSNCTA